MPRLAVPKPPPPNGLILAKTRNPLPITNPTRAATTRSQNVLPFRAATPSSRATMGKNVIAESLCFPPRHAHKHLLQPNLILPQLDQFRAASHKNVGNDAMIDFGVGQGHFDLAIAGHHLADFRARL